MQHSALGTLPIWRQTVNYVIGALPDPPKSQYKQAHSIILADSVEL